MRGMVQNHFVMPLSMKGIRIIPSIFESRQISAEERRINYEY